MSDVYTAWDRLRATQLAVKILRQDLAASPRFFQIFSREAEILRKLEHPNIVRLYEFDRDNDIVFIVMDFVDGTNLRQVIRKDDLLKLSEVLYILDPVVRALHYAHQNYVYHCDLKPSNILLSRDGRVLLSDFGVARLTTNKKVDEFIGGTPPYMSPAMFVGEAASVADDVYGLGILLYECLSGGKLPFVGASPDAKGDTERDRIRWEVINLSPPSLLLYNPTLDKAVEDVIFTAIKKEPSRRYATPLDLLNNFKAAAKIPEDAVTMFNTTLRENANPKSIALLPNFPVPVIQHREVGSKKDDLPSPQLLARSGELSGRLFSIPIEGVKIGRGSTNDILIRETSVSRTHAMILRRGTKCYLTDENSAVGTILNGERIDPLVPIRLHDDDVIQIGNLQTFVFREVGWQSE